MARLQLPGAHPPSSILHRFDEFLLVFKGHGHILGGADISNLRDTAVLRPPGDMLQLAVKPISIPPLKGSNVRFDLLFGPRGWLHDAFGVSGNTGPDGGEVKGQVHQIALSVRDDDVDHGDPFGDGETGDIDDVTDIKAFTTVESPEF
ncbi:alpha/beta-hydrolase [Aspergillus affinis]|uniref:alpha/beta-hydrolase n=1 Tax=Aspergillus affinis TaxID=1070780 RepID=UPI0022FF130A|nr:alpha/beta-hydrolase [Aspergillus affinis]KAI9036884.1 alpha/beta-hydrolase [Aspergillus affinis]